MSDNDKTKQELDRLKGKLVVVAFWGGVIALLLFIIVPPFFRPKDGLYMVNACNDRGACYTLRADVSIEEYDDGSTRGIWVNELYFNNGGSVELECELPRKVLLVFTTGGDTCYETDGDRKWDIELSKRLGERE